MSQAKIKIFKGAAVTNAQYTLEQCAEKRKRTLSLNNKNVKNDLTL